MATLHLKGYITQRGKLEVELPPDLPAGEVEVTLELTADDLPWEIRPWTDEEIQAMTLPDPKTGAEIAAMLDDMEPGFQHITDSAAWVEEQRRKNMERSRW